MALSPTVYSTWFSIRACCYPLCSSSRCQFDCVVPGISCRARSVLTEIEGILQHEVEDDSNESSSSHHNPNNGDDRSAGGEGGGDGPPGRGPLVEFASVVQFNF